MDLQAKVQTQTQAQAQAQTARADPAGGLDPLKLRIMRHLGQLLERDPRLEPVVRVAGEVLPRTHPPGFTGLARIICGQQLSVASAGAIWARLEDHGGTRAPEGFLALKEDQFRLIGLSRGKQASIRVVAQAIASGELDLAAAATLPAEQAIQSLTRYHGVGPWTAEIYLMFCAAHPDIFPVGDLALRKAVGDAFGIQPYPAPRAVADIAAGWAPCRSTAALLFWRFYAATRHRDALPV